MTLLLADDEAQEDSDESVEEDLHAVVQKIEKEHRHSVARRISLRQQILATDLRQNGRRLVLQHRPLQVPFLEGRLVKKHHQLFLAISLKFKALTYYI